MVEPVVSEIAEKIAEGFSDSAPNRGAGESSFRHVMSRLKGAGQTMTTRISDSPLTIPMAVGAAGFIAGALVGSRLARTMFLIGLGYMVREMKEPPEQQPGLANA